MTAAPEVGPASATADGTTTLGGHTADQLQRLGSIVGLDHWDTESYAQALVDSLGSVAERSLAEPPPSQSFLSDDHTPVEFSLSLRPGVPPTLRVLVEPGCAAESLADNGRTGLAAIREMADRWKFSTAQLDALEDLFFPSAPQGALALWYAWELRPGGVPKVKVYLNPGVSGPEHAADTVREALDRVGHGKAFTGLPKTDGYPFFALDLGDWETPRVKVYLTHRDLSAAEAGGLSRMDPGPSEDSIEEFFRIAAGHDPRSVLTGGTGQDVRLTRRPVLTCHSFTDTALDRPSGFTLHMPVRDYVRHDEEAHTRAQTALDRLGIDGTPLTRALPALTARDTRDGTGLLAYLALAYERDQQPRVTVYLSSEAYGTHPPRSRLPEQRRLATSPAHAAPQTERTP